MLVPAGASAMGAKDHSQPRPVLAASASSILDGGEAFRGDARFEPFRGVPASRVFIFLHQLRGAIKQRRRAVSRAWPQRSSRRRAVARVLGSAAIRLQSCAGARERRRRQCRQWAARLSADVLLFE